MSTIFLSPFVGFWIDYKLQARDLARFGLEVDAQNPARK